MEGGVAPGSNGPGEKNYVAIVNDIRLVLQENDINVQELKYDRDGYATGFLIYADFKAAVFLDMNSSLMEIHFGMSNEYLDECIRAGLISKEDRDKVKIVNQRAIHVNINNLDSLVKGVQLYFQDLYNAINKTSVEIPQSDVNITNGKGAAHKVSYIIQLFKSLLHEKGVVIFEDSIEVDKHIMTGNILWCDCVAHIVLDTGRNPMKLSISKSRVYVEKNTDRILSDAEITQMQTESVQEIEGSLQTLDKMVSRVKTYCEALFETRRRLPQKKHLPTIDRDDYNESKLILLLRQIETILDEKGKGLLKPETIKEIRAIYEHLKKVIERK
jgi:hypothetical protein